MKVIVTGATGMVGKGVLLECLDDAQITEVLSISRKATGITHPKLKELLHSDFSNFESVKDALKGYDACFHSMGVSSAGKSEDEFTYFTHTMTMALAEVLRAQNPEMVFTYVSGVGTDSTEKGRVMWARIKGKTENDLLKLGFKGAYMFRPGAIIPLRGIKSSTKLYQFMYDYFMWLVYFFKWVAPSRVVNTTQIGKAMIQLASEGSEKKIIMPPDIFALSGDAKA